MRVAEGRCAWSRSWILCSADQSGGPCADNCFLNAKKNPIVVLFPVGDLLPGTGLSGKMGRWACCKCQLPELAAIRREKLAAYQHLEEEVMSGVSYLRQ